MNIWIFYTATLTYCTRDFVSTLNFDNTQDTLSYANYPSWTDTTDGQGTLELRFKTNQRNGILLACSDGKAKRNSFYLEIKGGKLYVSFKMGADDYLSTKKIGIGSMWNDMEWHHVKVTRNFRDVTVSIDTIEKTFTSEGAADRLFLTSHVYVGGDPDKEFDGEGFTGCIEGLAYPFGREKEYPLSREGLVSNICLDKCSQNDREKLKCENNGRCVKYFKETTFKCDCSTTGASGATCSKTEPVLFLKRSTIISRFVQYLRVNRVNKIELRFRTNQESGIILHVGDSQHFILIELVKGVIKVKISLGTGSLTLSAGNGRLHDGGWHSVLFKRYGQQAFVNIDSDRFIEEKSFQYYPTKICKEGKEKVKLLLGGHTNARHLKISESKQNLEGCFQQVKYYQGDFFGIDLLKKALMRNLYARLQGNISTGCPVTRIPIYSTSTSVVTYTSSPDATTDFTTQPGDHIQAQQQHKTSANRLSQSTVAWITGGICIGSIAMIFTLACGFHFIRKRYSGKFLARSDGRLRKSAYGTTTTMHAIDDDFNIHSMKRNKPTTV